jgi:hypothetical protein
LAIRTLGDAIDASLVDLKGGTTGQVLAKASNTDMDFVWAADAGAPESLGFTAGKNKIINGDFRINQRALTSNTTDGFGFDRWKINQSGGTTTYSAQTFTAGAAPVAGYEATNYARLLTSGQSAAGDYALLSQNIESVRTFAGQTITISFWAQAGSGTPNIAVELDQQFGSGGSSRVTTYAGQVTLSTSWARYSVTVAVPSISGKTVGTASDFLSVTLWVSAGSTFNARTGSLGIQNNTFNIWGVQAENGSVATAFQTATGTIQGELAACQRYYQRIVDGTSQWISTGANFSASMFETVIRFPVAMRTAPTLVIATGTDYYSISRNGGTDPINSLTIYQATTQSTLLYNNSEVSGTAGHAGNLFSNNASASIAFNSEL